MMQSRRPTGLSPLAIVLPHPPLPRRRSSLLSINSATSPHTPRSCQSPCLPVYYPANRKSTDSWNSSNADEMEFEWMPEQVLLLQRTLDALPAHLVTPFHGPVPPSNLLDKIARGVSQAKGPADWPHSIRATRAKLLELARTLAKEEAAVERSRHAVIKEEVEIDDGSNSNYSYFHDGEEKPVVSPRRPLYRQSSMDFIKPGPEDIKENATIARLSKRLQRSDRLFPNPAYHPYSRTPRPTHTNRRSSSPPLPTDVPSLITPSTPSSSTLNSISSLSSSAAAPRVMRRSASTLSSSSMFSTSSSGMSLPDPRLQRVRRSDSLCSGPPAPPPKDYVLPPTAGFKRAPSYGALAQEVRAEHHAAAAAAAAGDRTHTRNLSGSYPSSDEEEKARSKRAKKIKTKTGSASASATIMPSTPSAPSPPASSAPSSPISPGGSSIMTAPSSPVVVRAPVPPVPAKDPKARKSVPGSGTRSPKSPTPKSGSGARSSSIKPEEVKVTGGGKTKKEPTRPAPMNLQRNPSMFGAELPGLKSIPSVSAPCAPASAVAAASSRVPPALSIYTKAPMGSTPKKARSPAPAPAPLPAPLSLSRALSPSTRPAPAQPQSPTSPTPSTPTTPLSPTATQRVRTLRRVRRLAPARRISFGSLLAPPGDEADADGEGEESGGGAGGRGCLGSAIQLL